MPNASEIEKIFTTARTAFTQWKEKSISERISYVSALRKVIVKNLDPIVTCISKSTGKVAMEAINSDILPTLELIKYYEKQAPKNFSTQKEKNIISILQS